MENIIHKIREIYPVSDEALQALQANMELRYYPKDTYIVQSSLPIMAVLPILANEAHGDVRYATGIVTASTVLFAAVIPVIVYALGV